MMSKADRTVVRGPSVRHCRGRVIRRGAFVLLGADYIECKWQYRFDRKRVLKVILISCRKRIAPILAEAARCDANAGWRLASLVLVLSN